MQAGENSGKAYDYGRTRASGVFALAAVASLGAVLLTGGAWSALAAGVESEAIADPPDLRRFAQALENGGEAAVAYIAPSESHAQTAEREGPAARGSR